MLTTSVGGSNDYAYGIAIQADGKIVVAGESSNGFNSDFALVRYTTSGVLDMTFDGDGKVITDFNSLDDAAYSIAIQADGKIIVAGSAAFPGTPSAFALVRYTNSGALDNSFDSDGKQTTIIGGYSDKIYAIAIQPDGKIVTAGSIDDGYAEIFCPGTIYGFRGLRY